MRLRTRKNDPLKIFALSGVLALCVGGLGFAAWQSIGTSVPDKYGCFSGERQSHTLVLVDASEPRFDAEQARSLRRYFDRLYDRLGFNEKLSVFTSEGDQLGSVAAPRFHVCGQATRPEQLERINAASGSAGYLQKQRERLYEKVLAPQLEALLSLNPDETRKQLHQSPVLELIADLSRLSEMKPGTRLVIVSDLIQNSDSARFCRVENDMPRFSAFERRRVYQERLKPRSLEGVEVEVLMLQRYGYAQEGMRYCASEEEIRAFWRDYFEANGVEHPNFIRIRYGMGGE